MKTPILGSSYVARTPNAADSRMVNLFPEIVPEGGKEPAFLQRCPGLVDTGYLSEAGVIFIKALYVATKTNTEIQYLLIFNSDGQIYRLDSIGTPLTYVGNFLGTSANIVCDDNGTQIFIANGIYAYIFNMATLAFAQVVDVDFTSALSVTYLDGFFVFNQQQTQKIWVTALLDGTSVDPLDFASAEASPDAVMAVIANHGELLVLGRDSIEWWYNAGTAGFPFARISGAYDETGCVSARTVAKLDNSVFWLGQDERGIGIIYRTEGYRAVRVSTHAIEWQIQRYSTISDAVAYTYQQDGHAFYVITFPTGDATFVYDVATQAWHERASWDGTSFHRHRGNCRALFQGVNLIGDYAKRLVYRLNPDVYLDNGVAIKWLRSWRALGTGLNTLKRSAHHSLQLDCETGVSSAVSPTYDNGEVSLRWSDDGGHTWSTPQTRFFGGSGQTATRVIWRRLGMTMKLRDRVYEVSGVDPNKVFIMGADLIASGTNA